MGAEKQRVLVVVINWNDIYSTINCLDSLYKSTYSDFDVVVIDNGSEQDPGEILKTSFPEITYIRNDENKGFTGANNQGMELAIQKDAEFVWLVNNDAIVEPDALIHLVECMQANDQLGLVSPILLDPYDNNCNYYGSSLDPLSLKISDVKSLADFLEIFDSPKNLTCLWGTALLIRIIAIKKIGMFDERFFAYFEDTDFSLRMQEGGWKNQICGGARIFHHNSRPNRPKYYYYYMARNKYLLDHKHSNPEQLNKNHRDWFSYYLRLAADLKAKQKRQESDGIIEGIWHALQKQYGKYETNKPIPNLIKRILLWHPYILASVICQK